MNQPNKPRLIYIVLCYTLAIGLLLGCNLVSTVTTATPQPPSPTAPEGAQPFIRIVSPTAADGGAVPVNVNGFAIAGEERGSFEGNVIVRALDANGATLQEQVTTSTGGEPGEVRQWGAIFSLDIAPGQTGTIYAFFTSAQDGSVVAEARLLVLYTTP